MEDQVEKLNKKRAPNLVKDFIAGGVGGSCSVLSGHPFDTIKVRIQTMPKPRLGEKPIYTGTFDCVIKTVKLEGFTGLYKGMGAPLVGVAPIFALMFMGFGFGKKIQQNDPDEELTNAQLGIAGGVAGVLTTVVMAPGERIKCILQVQQAATGPPKYKGPVDVVQSLYRTGGIRSIYRGTCATLLRDIPANAAYFTSYEIIKRNMAPAGGDPSQLSLGRTLLAGGLAGICNWVVALPPDVIKSRLQTAPDGTYNGVRDLFRHLLKEEGPKALFRGFVPTMLRAVPANACCFLGYEVTMSSLDKFLPNL
ncbi:hypothetical protein TCAL_05277 [Tigriopus californicus]|uniref:Mitochondrial carnitine/acylcarnitine carrier protein n=1 Tax=Tigriopus californicus TaxID=6832 RepID=A0A553NPX7_TIGCA|nr:protein dif-1-like [Tigriopus californicus]TRY67464.1 hypothetical protein TCAL_05277 [Tigriopus californicus]